MIESFAVKSVIFSGDDPIVLHYLISGALICLLLTFVALHSSLYSAATSLSGSRIFPVLLVWPLFALIMKPNVFEAFALFGFMLLVLCFYFALPVVCQRFGLSVRHLVFQFMVSGVLASVAMLVLYPEDSYELPSLRFRGVFISVAVACNMFFYACVYLTWAMKCSSGGWRYFYAGLIALSYVLLLMTFTKSSILQATLGIFLLSTDFKKPRILTRLVLVLCIFLMVTSIVLSLINIDALLENLRIIDNNPLANRVLNWGDGLDRAMDNMLLGEGLLSKQTQGGAVDLEMGVVNYSQAFDAHSLVISLVEQAGLPFMLVFITFMVWPLREFVRQFGWYQSLQTPEFVIMLIAAPSMMLAGGDMTSLGNLVNRLQWLFLGSLSFSVLLARMEIGGLVATRSSG